ncbi:diaminopimelate epimerase [Bermanella marisrubri]|uniref:Diaminopimelate epimerase n=1 Tax=Bermanella marisrubri TaxID=207949 RepID=Q1N419_9GAMM|nr:diaminopimelate epimerase [Bermanella marisrubri]EAT13046.1 diaminopimelate epimerase [Oceanobacter sp. RED65] [Bermanella marisrubri]QIZ82834.1 diaminopimelate epimerase [Bermanella marisrubri]
MLLKFTKMHGLGNDFMVVDLVTQHFAFRPEFVRQLSDRQFGIGFDQLLIVEPPSNPEVDFRYRIFNADGSEVEQCGNGARCFARFVHDVRLTAKNPIKVETSSGIIELNIEQDGDVVVNMGAARFSPSDLPFNAEQAERYQVQVPLNDGNYTAEFGAVSMGNPHCVMVVDDIHSELVNQLGPQLEGHEQFPKRVNAGFMQIKNRNEMDLRVYERGAGWTLACGTGACAAVAVAHKWGLVDDEVKVNLPGGALTIRWDGEGDVIMKGPVVRVFDGRLQV